MEELILKLKEKNKTISCCESLTGGMFASSIVNVSGASSVFVGGFVTYMDKAKEILLDGKDILKEKGAISKEMAYQMAYKVKEVLKSDIAISFTGNAGPFANEGKEVGLVYSCIIIDQDVYHFKDHYKGDRESIREQCIFNSKKRILEFLK